MSSQAGLARKISVRVPACQETGPPDQGMAIIACDSWNALNPEGPSPDGPESRQPFQFVPGPRSNLYRWSIPGPSGDGPSGTRAE